MMYLDVQEVVAILWCLFPEIRSTSWGPHYLEILLFGDYYKGPLYSKTPTEVGSNGVAVAIPSTLLGRLTGLSQYCSSPCPDAEVRPGLGEVRQGVMASGWP